MIAEWLNLLSTTYLDDDALTSLRKEMEDVVISERLNNSFAGQDLFQGLCLSGQTKGYPPAEIFDVRVYNPIKVRIEDLHDSILPNPCGETMANQPVLAANLVGVHPIAFADRPMGKDDRMPIFGEPVRCFFADVGPDDAGKMRGLRYEYPLEKHKFNFVCANHSLESVIGQFDSWATKTSPGASNLVSFSIEEVALAPSVVVLKDKEKKDFEQPVFAEDPQPPKKGKWIKKSKSVKINTKMKNFLDQIVRFIDWEIVVTNSITTESKQVEYIFKNIEYGSNLSEYSDEFARQMIAASPLIAEGVKVLKKASAADRGKHISGHAVDIRSWNMSRNQVEKLMKVADGLKATKVELKIKPPHIGIEISAPYDSSSSSPSSPSSPSPSSTIATPTSGQKYYIVKKDELFSHIAKRHYKTLSYPAAIKKLHSINKHISNVNRIDAGEKIIVPK